MPANEIVVLILIEYTSKEVFDKSAHLCLKPFGVYDTCMYNSV